MDLLDRLALKSLFSRVFKSHRKRSRARVSIAGQCAILQNCLRIKMFDFFLNSQNYRLNLIFLDILLNGKKIVKIIETRPQSSKKAPKWLKNC